MNLAYELPERDRLAALRAVGDPIQYCVPADVSLEGRRIEGFFVIGEHKWAYVEDGETKETCHIGDAQYYRMVPLVGNSVLEGVFEGTRRVIVRISMQHAARYAYIVQVLNSKAARRPIRIYNEEGELACIQCGTALVPGTRVCPKCVNKREAFKRLAGVSKKHWRLIGLGLLSIFVMTGVSLTAPYFQKLMINSALNPPVRLESSTRLFFVALAGLVFSIVFTQVLAAARGRIMARVSSEITADLRRLVFDKIQNLSLGFLTSQRAGEIMNWVVSDTERIRNLIQEICTTAIFQLTLLLGVSVMLFRSDWHLAIMSLLSAPLVVFLQVYMWRRVFKKLFHKEWRIYDKFNSFLHDVLSGIRVIKAFGQEEREITRFRKLNENLAAASFRSEKVFSYLWPISNYLIQIGQYLVLFVGCNLITRGNMTIGEMVEFAAYSGMVYGPLTWMVYLPRWMADAFIAANRVFSVIDEQPEVYDTSASVPHRIQGAVQFRNVTFGYKSYEPVLRDISFDVKPGEMIGLVGHSGAGKSTLINLIARFYDVNEGEILIDDIDILNIKQKELRSQIGVVLQETFLFSGSILDNIRFSKPDATLEDVIIATKIANAHDFISLLPDGYDTRLEENGGNLSGGERQRLAFARAVLCNPRILILDEATSALDINTESEIQEAMKRVTKNRTTFVIAHRLSTLKNADRLFVMDKGQIAEQGTHNELMEKKGTYYKLVMAQRNMNKNAAVEEIDRETETVS